MNKVTAVPNAQPDLKPARPVHNFAQPALSELRPPDPEPQEQAAAAQSAQSCAAATVDISEDLRDLDNQGLDDLLQQMCAPPRMHNPAQGPPPFRPK